MNETTIRYYNSNALKKEFAEVYRQFCASSNLVVSAPAVFGWAGYYSLFFGCPTICQNLPLRTYVGIKQRTDNNIVLDESRHFVPSRWCFENAIVSEITKRALEQMLCKELARLSGGRARGFTIKLLSEYTVATGLSASSSLGAALASTLFLYSKRCTPEHLEEWSRKPASELTHDTLFNDVFRLAWKIDCLLQGGLASGCAAFTAFTSSTSPVVYYVERQAKSPADIRPSLDPKGHGDYSLIDTLAFGAFHISELTSAYPNHEFPFDIFLIHTGMPLVRTISAQTVEDVTDRLTSTISFYEQKMLSLLTARHITLTPNFGSDTVPLSSHSLWNCYLTLATTITVNIIKYLSKCNARNATLDHLRALFRNLNDYQNIIKIFIAETHHTDALVHFLHTESRKLNYNNAGVGITLSSTAAGGYLILASPVEIRQDIPQLVEKFRATQDPQHAASLDFMSWRDGFDDRGVLLEQSLEHGQYATSISEGTVQLLRLTKDGLFEEMYTKEEFERAKQTMDVLLDPIVSEVRVRGEKLTSKDLRTTTQTIQLFEKIIQKPNTPIDKDELPDSGYTKDRNEFTSKIISPLIKAVEERIGRRLDIKVHGAIINFNVQCTPNDIDVYVVRKVF